MSKPPKSSAGAPAATANAARRRRAEPVGALLPEVGGMAFRRFGFAQGALVARWAEVVGPVYARWSIPESIRFPRGEKGNGTLTIRVEGPFSLQLQHVAPQIIERANRIFGHAAIARLRLVQGEVPKPSDRPKPAPRPPGAPAGNLSAVRDDGLRQALEALARELGGDGPLPADLPKVR